MALVIEPGYYHILTRVSGQPVGRLRPIPDPPTTVKIVVLPENLLPEAVVRLLYSEHSMRRRAYFHCDSS